MGSLCLHVAGVAAFVTCLIPARVTLASERLAGDGQPIRTSAYRLDLTQGPVLSSSRVLGMGGAYTAIAEGADGLGFNPAAAAVRPAHSDSKIEWDVTGGVNFPTLIGGQDFVNGTSQTAYKDFLFVTLGLLAQYGKFGVGLSLDAQQYDLVSPAVRAGAIRTTFQLARWHGYAARSFADDQVVLGGGLRLVGLTTLQSNTSVTLFDMFGLGGEAGAVVAPRHFPLRLGITLRTPTVATPDPQSDLSADANGDRKLGDLYLPDRVELPWELETGFAFQLGPRALNQKWQDPERVDPAEVAALQAADPSLSRQPAQRRIARRHYDALPRRKLLVSTALLVTGRVEEGVGLESTFTGVVRRSGQKATVSPRLGLEGELIPGWTQLRVGSYVEPTRLHDATPRVHLTGGFEQRLFASTLFGLYSERKTFRIGGAVDFSRDYFNFSAGIGFWH